MSIVLNLLVMSQAAAPPIEPPDMLVNIQAAGLDKLATTSATVYQDDRSGCMTMTFHYDAGDPEVKIPLKEIGWPTDFSGFRAIAFTLQSTSLEPVYIRFSNETWKKDVIVEPFEGVRIRGAIPFEGSGTETKKTNPAPLGYKIWPERISAPPSVKQLSFRMHAPGKPTQVALCNFALSTTLPVNDILDRRPVIDRYGQWIPETWDDKAYNDDGLKKIWAKEELRRAPFSFCPLGGDPRRKLAATGFFRTEKIGSRWALVDPHGHPFYSTGMDIVGVADSSFATEVTGRKYLFEQLPPAGPAWLEPGKVASFYIANLILRYGDNWKEKGEAQMIARLQSWGFNTIGNWSGEELAAKSGMPYVLPLYGWETRKGLNFPYGLPDVFSEEFAGNVDAAARKQCLPKKDDPNLIGWFLDNEPNWGHEIDTKIAWADIVLADPEPSATQTKLKELLAANPQDAANIKSQFLYECIRKYLETVTQAVRKYDPHHLILGVRFAGYPDQRWWKLSSLFDVFSVNVYSETFAPDPKLIKQWSEESGRPVLIGEFTAATPGRGMQGTFYGGHKVRDERERGIAYRYFVENSLASPYIIGTHWFQLVDDMPTGRPGDVERLNYGFVNVIDVPYEDLVRAAQETHRRMYELMFGTAKPAAALPRMN